MSVNCIRCVKNRRTGNDLLCDSCRAEDAKAAQQRAREQLKALMPPAGENLIVLTGHPKFYYFRALDSRSREMIGHVMEMRCIAVKECSSLTEIGQATKPGEYLSGNGGLYQLCDRNGERLPPE